MRKIIILLFLFFCFKVFSQQKVKDSIFILYNGDTELIQKSTSKISEISGFRILWYKYKKKESREKRLNYLKEHGGGVVNFYFGFTGVRNFIVNDSLNKKNLNSVEDISKRKILYNSNTKVFFIERLDYNSYKFHETHKTYE